MFHSKCSSCSKASEYYNEAKKNLNKWWLAYKPRNSSDVGKAIMFIGYALRYAVGVQAPIPSTVVLIGNLYLLFNHRNFSSDCLTTQFINIAFLISNIYVFLFELFMSLRCNVTHELDQRS